MGAKMPLTFRTLWLSDIHLGNPAARAGDLLQFLDSVSAERIYLVGDIIDLLKIKVRPRFPDVHRQVVTRLIRLANSDTEVIYIPGNHDFEFRDLAGRDICGVPVALEAVHETRDGARLLIAHGDILDGEIRRGTNLEHFGAAAYNLIMRLDVAINQLRSRLGHDYLSISRHIKARLASANEYIRRFEEIAARYAATRGFDGIVCGHIHRPGVRRIDGVWYANDGDWVEHRTALAEAHDGRLQILHWHQDGIVAEPATAAAAALAA